MITNKDLGEGPEGSPEARLEQRGFAANGRGLERPAADPFSGNPDRRLQQQSLQEQHAGEQWRRQILEQKNAVDNLQARIDHINAAIRSEGESAQGRQAERLSLLQGQLDEHKRKLEQMQDAARRAGMHTTVYDP